MEDLLAMDFATRDVSPPPLKRRKVSKSPVDHATTDGNPGLDRLTVFTWNINGIGPLIQRPITSFFESASSSSNSQHAGSFEGLREVLRRYSYPTMLFLQEVKIAPHDNATVRAVEKAILPNGDDPPESPSYKAFFYLPKDKHNARGFGRKVYGVCSIIREDFFAAHVERVREVEWDLEGRFLVCETKPIGSLPKLALVNLYAVNGTDAPYRDPDTDDVTGTRHDRKLQVHKHLQAECRELLSRGFEVVLAGDFNIARSAIDGHPNLRVSPKQHCINRADFEARFLRGIQTPSEESEVAEEGVVDAGLGMIDSFRQLHGNKAAYTYYPRGRAFGASCDRVDMIIVSSSLKDRLIEAGMYETPGARMHSDHVPLYITLLL